MEDRTGSVEAGKCADLLVVKGNPLKDLRLFQNPDNLPLIMKGGGVFKQAL
jgi:imidazolonepropionase-like amidohydrolase